MDRRQFLQSLALSSFGVLGVSKLLKASQFQIADQEKDTCLYASIQSFGYYQGLTPTQQRSPNRTDGTTYKMPCIDQLDIDHGEDRAYNFWHGHGSSTHKFIVTAEDFLRLKNGESIEIYTDIVDGHRHALKIDPKDHCAAP
jgi:hypothetical protein